ncbi:hypothetical protein ILYODFUR_020468 [Ilyodon furcidens]|uniref:Uncharacterized protein n=1 Tax=Ilyodon furcidens TaxID=33524 RepID=A0ABV0VIB1_9TELE
MVKHGGDSILLWQFFFSAGILVRAHGKMGGTNKVKAQIYIQLTVWQDLKTALRIQATVPQVVGWLYNCCVAAWFEPPLHPSQSLCPWVMPNVWQPHFCQSVPGHLWLAYHCQCMNGWMTDCSVTSDFGVLGLVKALYKCRQFTVVRPL